jgi:DNA replication protein DnaC
MQASARFNPKFQTFGERELVVMLNAAVGFVEDIDAIAIGSKPRWLSLLGGSGAGKTHLAKAIWRWFRTSPHACAEVVGEQEIIYPGQFASWRKVADGILGGNYSRIEELCSEKFVVIDDIGAEYQDKAGIVKAKLDRVIDARLGKWTVITCNLTLEQIATQMDTRIASRLIRGGSVVVETTAQDFNTRKL